MPEIYSTSGKLYKTHISKTDKVLLKNIDVKSQKLFDNKKKNKLEQLILENRACKCISAFAFCLRNFNSSYNIHLEKK